MSRLFLPLIFPLFFLGCTPKQKGMNLISITQYSPADSSSLLDIEPGNRYLLLPIQENKPEVSVRLQSPSQPNNATMDIRLAVDSIDYYVPMELPLGEKAQLMVRGIDSSALVFSSIKTSDQFDPEGQDYYRPTYHHGPAYGWMNDPNGMVYQDGVYHLYYQYNPYGSKWGNMHWGHSTSPDLVHWEAQPIALSRDSLGHIFSGSAVVDSTNSSGLGKDAILAFYTAHRWEPDGSQWQAQCLAVSHDHGRTYQKYAHNPILLPQDGIQDFRDPKVFWFAPKKLWYMILSADKEMRFYSSPDLKDWTYLSAFGEGYGAQPNQFECPDFFELPVDGNPEQRKWVMIVNINPGCLFGGSATEYFVGSFDGRQFVPETPKQTTKWMDYGKDHYAFVTFSNTADRILGLPWVSNWQYANLTPFKQSRGVNGLPRELSLFTQDGATYLASAPAKEVLALRKKTLTYPDTEVQGSTILTNQLVSWQDSYEVCLRITPAVGCKRIGLELSNTKGERLPIYLDLVAGKLVMDRAHSGLVDFGKEVVPHARENHNQRKENSINYQNDFALATWAPLSLLRGKSYELRLFVDRSTVELFVDGGRIVMTNLVFPTEYYRDLRLFTEGGKAEFSEIAVHQLGL